MGCQQSGHPRVHPAPRTDRGRGWHAHKRRNRGGFRWRRARAARGTTDASRQLATRAQSAHRRCGSRVPSGRQRPCPPSCRALRIRGVLVAVRLRLGGVGRRASQNCPQSTAWAQPPERRRYGTTEEKALPSPASYDNLSPDPARRGHCGSGLPLPRRPGAGLHRGRQRLGLRNIRQPSRGGAGGRRGSLCACGRALAPPGSASRAQGRDYHPRAWGIRHSECAAGRHHAGRRRVRF